MLPENFCLEGGDACLPACLRKRRANYINLLLTFHSVFSGHNSNNAAQNEGTALFCQA